MRGPPITVRCECGESRSLRYGERWTCERCGRTWNTEQIPASEYRGLVRSLRRLRWAAVGAALVLGGALVVVALLVNQALVFIAPIVLAAIAIFSGPFWKRKVRRTVAERPSWHLEPE